MRLDAITKDVLREDSGAFDIDEEMKLLDNPYNMSNNPTELTENAETEEEVKEPLKDQPSLEFKDQNNLQTEEKVFEKQTSNLS